jgi:two-component system, chemotaxis family, chemotaxis protein CheY
MDLSGRTVLVLDDSHSFRMLICAMLRGMGARSVQSYDDADAAMIYLRNHKTDVALIGGGNAGSVGFRFATALRIDTLQSCRTLPLVLLSGAGHQKQIRRMAVDAGFDAVLPKPLRQAQLQEALERVLNHPRVYIHARDGYCGPDRRRDPNPGFPNNVRRGGETFQVHTKDGPISLDQLEELQKAGAGKGDLEVLLVRGVKVLSGYRLNAQAVLAA